MVDVVKIVALKIVIWIMMVVLMSLNFVLETCRFCRYFRCRSIHELIILIGNFQILQQQIKTHDSCAF